MENVKTVKVRTDYSYEQLRAYQRFRNRKERLIVLIIVGLLVIVFTADAGRRLAYGTGWDTSFAGMPELLLSIGFLVVLYGSLDGWFYSKSRHSTSGKIGGGKQCQEFGEAELILTGYQADLPTRRVIPYDAVKMVWETPDMFYLYLRGSQAFLVDKAGFQEGGPEELSSLLKERTRARYRTAGRDVSHIAR